LVWHALWRLGWICARVGRLLRLLLLLGWLLRRLLLTLEWRWWPACVGLQRLQWDYGVMTALAARDNHALQNGRVDDVHHQHGLEESVAELRINAEKRAGLVGRRLHEAPHLVHHVQ